MTQLSPFAGLLPEPADLADIPRLLRAYETDQPDPAEPGQLISFGTSGHRGTSLNRTFNEHHILAMTQAICGYRKAQGVSGPLFLGYDTHALSLPAFRTALEVLAANEVTVLVAQDGEFTPTPVISHATLGYNKGRSGGLADGIVITPSHNPPTEGGFKYNPVHGGPAEKEVTDWIQREANRLLTAQLAGIRRIPYERAALAPSTRSHDYITPYVGDLGAVLDLELIRDSKIRMGVNPLGGAGVHYWQRIADHYRIDLTVLNTKIDPCFAFMTRDWDGKIRMDPSSSYAMRSVIEEGRRFDISFACDTDHDRHGIVSPRTGLMPANDYLAAAISYLFNARPLWPRTLRVGKTVVSSQLIDRVAARLDRALYEVPVGFKWFVEGLLRADLGFAGEESAGATFLRKDGSVWTTDKDAFVPALLSAELTARLGKDPAAHYGELTASLGVPVAQRIEAPANASQRSQISKLSADQVRSKELAGEPVERILTLAPGNGAPIGGLKVQTRNGWFAARPSGTEDIYKIYAESFLGQAHLERLLEEARGIVDQTFT